MFDTICIWAFFCFFSVHAAVTMMFSWGNMKSLLISKNGNNHSEVPQNMSIMDSHKIAFTLLSCHGKGSIMPSIIEQLFNNLVYFTIFFYIESWSAVEVVRGLHFVKFSLILPPPWIWSWCSYKHIGDWNSYSSIWTWFIVNQAHECPRIMQPSPNSNMI